MSQPTVLLVDDSEAVIAYECAALAGHYALTSASNGREGLQQARAVKPDLVLLDLSMPEMSGDDVLAAMKADENLANIPVIIVSSERARAEACVKRGAAAYLAKPFRAEDLRALVARTLEDVLAARRSRALPILFVGIGPREFGIELQAVRSVVLHPMTQALATGPSFVSDVVEIHGEMMGVLDLARPLGVEHAHILVERKLVVLSQSGLPLAVSVDTVRDPVEIRMEDVFTREQLSGMDDRRFSRAVRAVVRTEHGPRVVVEPEALFSRALLKQVRRALESMASDTARELAE